MSTTSVKVAAILDSRRDGGVTGGTQRDEICAYSSVLIGGDEIDARGDCGAPAHARGVERREIVAGRPSHALAVFGRMTVQRVEANPQSAVVRRADPQTQSIGVLRRPFPRVVLSLGLDDAPRIVRPAAIVRGGGAPGSAWSGVDARPVDAPKSRRRAPIGTAS